MDQTLYVNFNNEILILILQQPEEDVRSIYDQSRVVITGNHRRVVYDFYVDMMSRVKLPHLRTMKETDTFRHPLD